MIGGLFLKMRDDLSKTGISLIRPEYFFMILMGAIVGGAVGYGAIGFRGLISVVAQSRWGFLAGLEGRDLLEMPLSAPFWVRVLIPTAGGLIVGLIISFVAQEAKGHGVPEVIEAVAFRDCHLLFGSLKTFSRKVFERDLKGRRVLEWRKNELTMTCNGDRKD